MRDFFKTTFLSLISCFLTLAYTETCSATEYFLIAETPFTPSAVTSSDVINFTVVPGRSYCLEMRTVTGAVLAAIQALSVTDTDLIITDSSRGDASPPIYSPGITNFSSLSRKCFIAAGNNSNVSSNRVRATLTFTSGTSAGQTEVRLQDTTLIGGFNTGVTDFNFLELTNSLAPTNRDSGVISGTITAKNVITDVVFLTRSFSVNAGNRLDVNLHDAVGPGAFGIIIVSHNGPSGSLKGQVSQYRLVSTVPFDFEPVVQQQLLRPSGLP